MPRISQQIMAQKDPRINRLKYKITYKNGGYVHLDRSLYRFVEKIYWKF